MQVVRVGSEEAPMSEEARSPGVWVEASLNGYLTMPYQTWVHNRQVYSAKL